jgi:hypothetical protein
LSHRGQYKKYLIVGGLVLKQEAVIDTVRQLLAAKVPAQFRRADEGDQDRMVA